MAMTMTEIVAKSDKKRGVKLKGFKLPLSVIAEIEQLSREYDIPQNKLIIQAIEAFKTINALK